MSIPTLIGQFKYLSEYQNQGHLIRLTVFLVVLNQIRTPNHEVQFLEHRTRGQICAGEKNLKMWKNLGLRVN